MPRPSVLVIQLADDDPPGPLADWLHDAGADMDLRNLAAGDSPPADLKVHAGVIVLGGGMGAHDDTVAPYLPAVRELLRLAVAEHVATLGICLGAQLLAVANGGRVVRGDDGPEIGAQLVAKRSAASTDPLFRELPITPDVLQWHFDVITSLPPGAVHLASSPVYDNQAFRLGTRAWGIQFHIETTPAVVRRWARDDAGALDHLDLDRVLRRAEAVHGDIAEVWAPFVRRFVATAADPAAGGSGSGGGQDAVAAARSALAAQAAAARVPPVLPMPSVRPPDD